MVVRIKTNRLEIEMEMEMEMEMLELVVEG